MTGRHPRPEAVTELVTKTDVTCCDAFSSSTVVSRDFSALRVYAKFEHHPHPLGYLFDKFSFFRGFHC